MVSIKQKRQIDGSMAINNKTYQIPRNSLAWMLVAQVAAIAPHLPRLSLWIIGVCAVCGIWRVMVFQGRWSYPGRWVKIFLVIGGMVGIPLTYKPMYGLEPAIALLMVAFVLKLLEMHHKRDAYVVILLAYFVTATEFLFDQTIPMTIYMFGVITMVTAALIGLNQSVSHVDPFHTLKLSVRILLQAMPLMLVLFIFFPRIQPLWTVPLQRQIAVSGVSGTVTLGDIAEVSKSDDLAFRVTFEGEVPPASQLYWRGLVLSIFDGKTWTRLPRRYLGLQSIQLPQEKRAEWDRLIERRGDPIRYSIIQEPTNQNWLFALPTMTSDTPNVGLVRDYRLYSRIRLQKRFRYEVTSHLSHRIEKELSNHWKSIFTLLPGENNPKSREFARSMFAQSSNKEEYIGKVLQLFNTENFVYTLKPVTLGDDPIDEFLLESKQGFCEHYAATFVFLMRAAGIPSRMIVGYQGGEFNGVGNYLAVRQFDAHAWAEVWIKDRGWIRIDPTTAVAPERIEDGLQAAVEDTFLEDSPFSWLRYSQTLWLTELRLQLSALTHYWDSWVVGYNPSTQMKFMSQFFDNMDFKRMGMILLVSVFSILGMMAIFLLRTKEKIRVSAVDREYLRFCSLVKAQRLVRKRGEGPLDYANRVSASQPRLEKAIGEVTKIYVALNYEEQHGYDLKDLKQAVRAFRVKSATTPPL